jgi:NTE family protein
MAQLGVLKVLDREGIPVSFVTGTGIGAIIGALYATSDSALHAEERLLAHLVTDRIGFNIVGYEAVRAAHACHSSGFLDLVDALWQAVRPRGGLIGAAAIRASLRQLLGEATFAETRLPFAATAFDLVSGRLVHLVEGPLVEAVYASSAIAGLLEPSLINGHILVDGGLAEPVPVQTCHHLGAIHVLAIDVTGPRIQETEAGAVSTDMLADALTRQLLGERQLGEADIVIRPLCVVEHFADVSNPAGLIASGERATEEVLPEIAAVLDRSRSRCSRHLNLLPIVRQSRSPYTHDEESSPIISSVQGKYDDATIAKRWARLD